MILRTTLLLSLALTPVGFAEDLRPLSEQELAAIEWFESLGYPDIAKAPLVRVKTGAWDVFGGQQLWGGMNEGFVLTESATEITILTPLLDVQRIPIGSQPPVYKQRREVWQLAHRVLNPPPAGGGPQVIDDIDRSAKLWFVGYACLKRGRGDLARDLFGACQGGVPDLVAHLKEHISHAEMWRMTRAIGNASVSRKELVERHRQFVKRFPKSKHVERATPTLEMLEKMLKEDETYAELERKPWAEMPEEEQIDDAIFRLRDQSGHQFSEPGAPSIFDFSGRSIGAADQLVAIGKAAIPALIDCVGDQRLSRCNGRHRSFYFSEYTLTIEKCALQVISKISGKNFHRGRETDEELRTRLLEWWTGNEGKSESQALVDEVSAGTKDSINLATRLIEKDPRRALDAIEKGVAAAPTPWIRARLVEQVRALDTAGMESFFERHLANGADVDTRIAAAEGLARLELGERAVSGVLVAWDGWRKGELPAGDHTSADFRDRMAAKIARFIVEHGDAKSVAVFSAKLSEHALPRRMSSVRALGAQLKKLIDAKSDSKDMREAIEAALVSALSDLGQSRTSGSTNGVRFNKPRVCDWAAHKLSQAFDWVVFDLSADEAMRDRQLEKIRKAVGE